MKTYIVYGGNVPRTKHDLRRPRCLAVTDVAHSPETFRRILGVDRVTNVVEIDVDYPRAIVGFYSMAHDPTGCGLCAECAQHRVWH